MVNYYVAHSAVAATATSEVIPVEGAKKVSFWFNRTNHSSGSTAFSISGSIDGTNFVTMNNILTDAANTNAQTNIRVASVSLASDTSSIASLDIDKIGLKSIKVVCTITTDGKGNCNVSVEN